MSDRKQKHPGSSHRPRYLALASPAASSSRLTPASARAASLNHSWSPRTAGSAHLPAATPLRSEVAASHELESSRRSTVPSRSAYDRFDEVEWLVDLSSRIKSALQDSPAGTPDGQAGTPSSIARRRRLSRPSREFAELQQSIKRRKASQNGPLHDESVSLELDEEDSPSRRRDHQAEAIPAAPSSAQEWARRAQADFERRQAADAVVALRVGPSGAARCGEASQSTGALTSKAGGATGMNPILQRTRLAAESLKELFSGGGLEPEDDEAMDFAELLPTAERLTTDNSEGPSTLFEAFKAENGAIDLQSLLEHRARMAEQQLVLDPEPGEGALLRLAGDSDHNSDPATLNNGKVKAPLIQEVDGSSDLADQGKTDASFALTDDGREFEGGDEDEEEDVGDVEDEDEDGDQVGGIFQMQPNSARSSDEEEDEEVHELGPCQAGNASKDGTDASGEDADSSDVDTDHGPINVMHEDGHKQGPYVTSQLDRSMSDDCNQVDEDESEDNEHEGDSGSEEAAEDEQGQVGVGGSDEAGDVEFDEEEQDEEGEGEEEEGGEKEEEEAEEDEAEDEDDDQEEGGPGRLAAGQFGQTQGYGADADEPIVLSDSDSDSGDDAKKPLPRYAPQTHLAKDGPSYIENLVETFHHVGSEDELDDDELDDGEFGDDPGSRRSRPSLFGTSSPGTHDDHLADLPFTAVNGGVGPASFIPASSLLRTATSVEAGPAPFLESNSASSRVEHDNLAVGTTSTIDQVDFHNIDPQLFGPLLNGASSSSQTFATPSVQAASATAAEQPRSPLPRSAPDGSPAEAGATPPTPPLVERTKPVEDNPGENSHIETTAQAAPAPARPPAEELAEGGVNRPAGILSISEATLGDLLKSERQDTAVDSDTSQIEPDTSQGLQVVSGFTDGHKPFGVSLDTHTTASMEDARPADALDVEEVFASSPLSSVPTLAPETPLRASGPTLSLSALPPGSLLRHRHRHFHGSARYMHPTGLHMMAPSGMRRPVPSTIAPVGLGPIAEAADSAAHRVEQDASSSPRERLRSEPIADLDSDASIATGPPDPIQDDAEEAEEGGEQVRGHVTRSQCCFHRLRFLQLPGKPTFIVPQCSIMHDVAKEEGARDVGEASEKDNEDKIDFDADELPLDIRHRLSRIIGYQMLPEAAVVPGSSAAALLAKPDTSASSDFDLDGVDPVVSSQFSRNEEAQESDETARRDHALESSPIPIAAKHQRTASGASSAGSKRSPKRRHRKSDADGPDADFVPKEEDRKHRAASRAAEEEEEGDLSASFLGQHTDDEDVQEPEIEIKRPLRPPTTRQKARSNRRKGSDTPVKPATYDRSDSHERAALTGAQTVPSRRKRSASAAHGSGSENKEERREGAEEDGELPQTKVKKSRRSRGGDDADTVELTMSHEQHKDDEATRQRQQEEAEVLVQTLGSNVDNAMLQAPGRGSVRPDVERNAERSTMEVDGDEDNDRSEDERGSAEEAVALKTGNDEGEIAQDKGPQKPNRSARRSKGRNSKGGGETQASGSSQRSSPRHKKRRTSLRLKL